MTILLVNNRFNERTEIKAREIAEKLKARGIEVAIDNGPDTYYSADIDGIVVLGGDGTVLRAARQYGQRKKPVMAVNMGTVGFLSSIDLSEFDTYIEAFIQGKYLIDERIMLDVSIFKQDTLLKRVFCLNEMVIKSGTPRMLEFSLDIDGKMALNYQGDGLIIATPTGSTAYSLSAGGPILEPVMESLLLTPIASHMLNRRPLVLSSKRILSLSLPKSQKIIISMDGQVSIELSQESWIELKQAREKLQLLKFNDLSFFPSINGEFRKPAKELPGKDE